MTIVAWTFLSIFHLHAQDVWKEGTRWEVTFSDENASTFTYKLQGHSQFDGTDYLNLICEEEDSTIGYVRAEHGDTVVYARMSVEGSVTREFLLYDFGTFQPETTIQYAVRNEDWSDLDFPVSMVTDTIKAQGLTYYHDIIDIGDILPCWDGILFKIGCLEGPMAFLYDPLGFEIDPTQPPGPGPYGPDVKPKRRNISHTVLKLVGRTIELTPAGIISIKVNHPTPYVYDLQGKAAISTQKGIYIVNHKKTIR